MEDLYGKNDRELLIKEISTRLHYGVKAKVLGWNEEKGEIEVPLRIYSINTDGYVYFETNDYDVNCLNIENCLLYLRPMSSITEEEISDLQKITPQFCFNKFDNSAYVGAADDGFCSVEEMDKILDYLNSKHLDYRGLIPMGLALVAPNDMYK